MSWRKERHSAKKIILGFLALTPGACNEIAGIESGKLGLCPDGSRIEETNCEGTSQSGAGGSGSSGTGGGTNALCNAPWQRRDATTGRCYLQEFGPREWASAEQRCVDLGGHLIAIDSATELAQVAEWMNAEVWIGGTDAANEGVFVWTNGQEWSFASWKDGIPVDISGNRDCVMLTTSNGNLPVFKSRFCTEKLSYICESAPTNP